MSLPAPPPVAAPSPQAQRRIHLEGKVQSFALGPGDHEVGRLPQCSIHIEGPQISRRHAILHITATEVVIEDLGSANGVFVNGKRITGRQVVANDDLVHFGDLGFRVRIASEAESSGSLRPKG
jgi:pSer/pThr/pTyr-binding forkhead associated (FHA) protein